MPANIYTDGWWKCQEQLCCCETVVKRPRFIHYSRLDLRGSGWRREWTIGAQVRKKCSFDFNPFLTLSHLQLVSQIPGISLLFSMRLSFGPLLSILFPFEAALDIKKKANKHLVNFIQSSSESHSAFSSHVSLASSNLCQFLTSFLPFSALTLLKSPLSFCRPSIPNSKANSGHLNKACDPQDTSLTCFVVDRPSTWICLMFSQD